MARKKADDQTAAPATPTASAPATEALTPDPALRVTAKPRQGFRRCGVHHPATPVDHPEGRFSKAEIDLLKAEPNLIVEEL